MAAASSYLEQAVIDRQGLADGSTLADYRRSVPPGTVFPSDEELERGLDAVLSSHTRGADLYIFCYGSLMWNPAMDFAEVATATVRRQLRPRRPACDAS